MAGAVGRSAVPGGGTLFMSRNSRTPLPAWANWYAERAQRQQQSDRDGDNEPQARQNSGPAQDVVFQELLRLGLAGRPQPPALQSTATPVRAAVADDATAAAAAMRSVPPVPPPPLRPSDIHNLPLLDWHDNHAVKDCAVCMQSFGAGQQLVCLPCSPLHAFHRECIGSWMVRQSTCPICRSPLGHNWSARIELSQALAASSDTEAVRPHASMP